MKNKPHSLFILLASESPRRREILTELGLPFQVIRSRYSENDRNCNRPANLVKAHAVGKAKNAMVPFRKGIVLGADTIVYHKGKIYGKPHNKREAVRMLSELSGCCHRVYTGIALYDPESRTMLCDYAKTLVWFKTLNAGDIADYLKTVHPLDKAGAYAIQEGPGIVRKIKGSYTNVIGLPAELLIRMLRKINSTKKLRFKPRTNRISTFAGQNFIAGQ